MKNFSMKTYKRRTRHAQRGVYIAVGVFIILVFLFLCALVIGLGLVSTDKTRLQNINNLTSLAALEEFNRLGAHATIGHNYGKKQEAALRRANMILQSNKLAGTHSALGDVGLATLGGGAGGSLTFGSWFPEDPDNHPDTTSGHLAPCNGNYPCFRANTEAGSLGTMACTPHSDATESPNKGWQTADCETNAVRLVINNQPNNPLFIPFGKLMGQAHTTLTTTSTAALVERCTAMLVDVSGSASDDTHLRTGNFQSVPGFNNLWSRTPPDPSPPSFGPCPTGASPPYPSQKEQMWCQFIGDRNFSAPGAGVTRTGPYAAYAHYQSDYRNVDPNKGALFGEIPTNFGDLTATHATNNILVDRYVDANYEGPQPLVDFLKSFNSGIEKLRESSVAGDRAMVSGFSRNLLGPTGLSNNFDFLLQLTNTKNRGTFTLDSTNKYVAVSPSVRPNFVDRGWVPIQGNRSNIVAALGSTIDALQQCPTTARKSIILATDGVADCADCSRPVPDTSALFCVGKVNHQCGAGASPPHTRWDSFRASESQLLDSTNTDGILYRLIQSRIILAVMLYGKSVAPNFLNIPRASGGGFYEPDELVALGYGGINNAASKVMVDFSGGETEFKNLSSSGVLFRRPNGIFAEMVSRTKGIWCPLLSPAGGSYDGLGNYNGPRPVGARQEHPLLNLSILQQAIICVQKAIGSNPFTLVEDPEP